MSSDTVTSPGAESPDTSGLTADEERALMASASGTGIGIGTGDVDGTELQTRTSPSSQGSRRLSISSTIRRKTSQVLDAVRGYRNDAENSSVPQKLAELVALYEATPTSRSMRAEFDAVYRAHGGPSPDEGNVAWSSNGTIGPEGTRADMHEMRDITTETSMLRGRQRASWGTQFRILSGRAFKNLYRDPALLTAHYTSSVALARELLSIHVRSEM